MGNEDDGDGDGGLWDDADVISVYSREDAIQDGSLIDMSPAAKEAGFKCPVALTQAVWCAAIVPSAADAGRGQSVMGRMWDVLSVLRVHCRASQGSEILFKVLVERGGHRETTELKAIIGPGDTHAPVITIMLPEED